MTSRSYSRTFVALFPVLRDKRTLPSRPRMSAFGVLEVAFHKAPAPKVLQRLDHTLRVSATEIQIISAGNYTGSARLFGVN
jgi:hypothetical protein